jgi:transketolase
MIATKVKPFFTALEHHGELHDDVMVVTNDLTSSCEADGFAKKFPDRYLSAGMAEQSLVLTLAGLAREGLKPIYPSFAVFTTRRPYEQIALTIAYPNLPVRLFGFLPGLTTPGGVSHQAIDDLGLMRALPNMTVIETADSTDMESILEATYKIQGPVYIRSLRGNVPTHFEEPITIGKCRNIFDGNKVLVLVSGSLTSMAIETVEQLRHSFPELGLICVNTLKPFNDTSLFERLAAASTVITLENHLVATGLGSTVAMHLAKNPGPVLVPMGISDTFTHGGSADYLFTYYGLGSEHLVFEIKKAFGELGAKANVSSTNMNSKPTLTENVAEGL